MATQRSRRKIYEDRAADFRVRSNIILEKWPGIVWPAMFNYNPNYDVSVLGQIRYENPAC